MFKKRWLKKQKLRAVHDNEIENLLSSIGIWDRIVRGDYMCSHCGETITIENLGAFYPEGDEINLVCERTSCMLKVKFSPEVNNE